jgi:hypothetical protein
VEEVAVIIQTVAENRRITANARGGDAVQSERCAEWWRRLCGHSNVPVLSRPRLRLCSALVSLASGVFSGNY